MHVAVRCDGHYLHLEKQLEQRTAAAADQGRELLAGLGIPGAITAFGLFILNLFRNTTRRRELEQVENRVVQGSGHAS